MKWLKFFRGSQGQAKDDSPSEQMSPISTEAQSERAASAMPPDPVRQVLVIESQAAEVEAMRARFAELGGAWQCRFTATSSEATAALAEGSIDAVIAPSELPDTSGTAFIERVAAGHPRVARIIRHGSDEKKSTRKPKGLPPCYLEHTYDASGLLAVLRRAFQLERWMQGDQAKELLLRMDNLPAVPSLYARVLGELRSEDPSIEAVGKLVAKDPALTAKMLQLVNSPYFALGHPVSDAVEAVTFLGAERTKALILMASLSLHGNMSPCEGFSQDQFWQHSLSVGTLARNITRAQGKNASLADQAFTAGLLHDIGKLLFAANLPSEYGPIITTATNEGLTVHEVEVQAFGVDHAHFGASLLGTWGLPMPVLEAIAYHHAPTESSDSSFSLLAAVHVANVFDYEKKSGDGAGLAPQLSDDYIARLNLTEQMNQWREVCGCPPRPAGRASGDLTGKNSPKAAF
jgi:putative nucleotidyltransferase with HDIG domain